jgi:aminoglycoside phosphotransferase (APT) family kinase protein
VNALALADKLAGGGPVQDLSGGSKALGVNRVFRLWNDSTSRILKVYGTPARERRERHALDALGSLLGLPTIIDRGMEDDLVWALFEDAGRWTLASLPENPGLARKAGEILRSVHEAAPSPMSNLSRGIDQEWVAVDYVSTFRRLERFRHRVGVSMELLQQAREIRPPFASAPRSAHTDPKSSNFLVDDEGKVTVINWEWATLAPPEWDLSKAVWQIGLNAGPSAAAALQDGYGKTLDQEQLDRWIVYHAGMTMVFEAEQQVSTGSAESYTDLAAELRRAVTGAGSVAATD